MKLHRLAFSDSERVLVHHLLSHMAGLFKSFVQAGFVCSTHWLRGGRRLDLIAAACHDCVTEADLLVGRQCPECGGDMPYLDILGANYYWNNQWIHTGSTLNVGHPQYRPFHCILSDVYKRYRYPLFIAETGVEVDRRPAWLAYIGVKVRTAMQVGLPLVALCWYPVVNHSGRDDEHYCPNGLFDSLDEADQRRVYEPLALELQHQQTLFCHLLGAVEAKDRTPALAEAHDEDQHPALH